MAFIDFIEEIFTMKDVNDNKLAFLSNNLCQDPLENFFGCQRQRGGTSDNPTLHEFYNNTQALRVQSHLHSLNSKLLQICKPYYIFLFLLPIFL